MSQHKPHNQHERFVRAARELGCDNSEEAVDELMKRVASSPPPRKDEKPNRASKGSGGAKMARPTKAKSR